MKYLLHWVYNQVSSLMNEFHNLIYFHLHLCPAKRMILQTLKIRIVEGTMKGRQSNANQQFVLPKSHVFHLILVDFYRSLSKEKEDLYYQQFS